MKKRYGFFGGGFNPPTYAHIELAKQVMKQMQLEKLFFVPVGNLYQKPELIDEIHRYEMLKLVTDQKVGLEVSTIELKQKKSLSTIDAFHLIQKTYWESENFFIMGIDNLKKLPSWKDAVELIENFQYVILNRGTEEAERVIEENELLRKNKNHFSILENKEFAWYHSGEIREKIKQGKTDQAALLTNPKVIDYILKYKLYV